MARCSTKSGSFIKGRGLACSCVALSIAAESRHFRVCPAPRSPADEFRPQQPFFLISRTPGSACQRSSTRCDGYRIPKRSRQTTAVSPSRTNAAGMIAFHRSPFPHHSHHECLHRLHALTAATTRSHLSQKQNFAMLTCCASQNDSLLGPMCGSAAIFRTSASARSAILSSDRAAPTHAWKWKSEIRQR